MYQSNCLHPRASLEPPTSPIPCHPPNQKVQLSSSASCARRLTRVAGGAAHFSLCALEPVQFNSRISLGDASLHEAETPGCFLREIQQIFIQSLLVDCSRDADDLVKRHGSASGVFQGLGPAVCGAVETTAPASERHLPRAVPGLAKNPPAHGLAM